MTQVEKFVETLREGMSEYRDKGKLTFSDLHDHVLEKTGRKISIVTLNQFIDGSRPSVESMITYERFLKEVEKLTEETK